MGNKVDESKPLSQTRLMSGRRVIKTSVASITEENVGEVLQKALSVHNLNRSEIDYLWKYYRGEQPIQHRTKDVRPEICNKIVENRANEIVSFKVGYLCGEPIQYVSRNGGEEIVKAINTLNEFMFAEDKSSQDQELVEWQMICGTGYRLVLPDEPGEEDEAPFELFTLDPRDTFVVYSNEIGNKPMMAVKYSKDDNEIMHYSIYTENRYYLFDGDILVESKPHALDMIPIFEYPANNARLGAFEIVLPLLDAINNVESNRMDGMEQLVQAFIKFINCDITKEEYEEFLQLGAIKVKSVDGQTADVGVVTTELNQTQSQTLKDDYYNAVLTICGMPNRNGGSSTSDTGSAVLLRDGWSDAEARAKDSENVFKKSEKKMLKLVLRICRDLGGLDLHLRDIDMKFTRRNYEAIQSKSQVLISITEFFSDPLGWIKEHIVDPFVEGFKNLFGIHSPSTVMAAVGSDVAQGLLNGILEPFKAIGKWIKKNILDPIKHAIEKSPVGELVIGIKNNISSLWDKVKGWWADATKDGITVEAAVELVKQGWHTVRGWIGNIPIVSQAVGLLKSGWESVKGWIGNIPTLEQGIELVKKKWDTVTKWVGEVPVIQQGIELVKDRWNSVKEWVGNIPVLSQYIQLLKHKWSTVREWVGNIPVLDQAIQLVKHLWSSVRDWIGQIPVLDQGIQLKKYLWTSVKNWIGNIPVLDQGIQLTKHLWSSVKNWIGNIPVLSQGISLMKSSWEKVSSWVEKYKGGTVSQGISLTRSGWTTVAAWVKNKVGGVVSVGVSLFKSGWGKIKDFFGLSSGGIVGANGGVKIFANGGSIDQFGNWWSSVPKYATGTPSAGAHGTMFVAGEDGAEMVGHVNGTTEVLNRFQLASVMHSSIVAGMAQFTGYWRMMNSQMVTCTNAIIRAVLATPDMTQYAFAGVTSYDPTNALAQSVYEDSSQAYNRMATSSDFEGAMNNALETYYRNHVASMAEDIRKQADKEEQTIVQVGDRTITDAVERQQKANGFKGDRGIDGVSVTADGHFAFNVSEAGHLILSYTGDEAPDFSINEDGHLIYNF